ncbi:MAG: hypothetical protein QF561_05950 [Phycisphaerales bacterium]|nr:hypothetical protein [Phycisphaerales bacterium]
MTFRMNLFLLCIMAIAAASGARGQRTGHHDAASHHQHTHVHVHGGHVHTHTHSHGQHIRDCREHPAHADHDCEEHHWCDEHHGTCHACDVSFVARLRTASGASTPLATVATWTAPVEISSAVPRWHRRAVFRPPDYLSHLQSVVLRT